MPHHQDLPFEPATPDSAFTLNRRSALGLLGAAALAVPMARPAWAQAARKRGGVLRIAANTNPSSLDPATGGQGNDHTFLWTLFDTLVEWDYDTLKPRPGLAQWSFPDPKTMVLDIRPDVVFHDGTPCDAQAVKFNIDRNRTDPRSNVKADLVNVTAVQVTGALQLKLTLARPDVALPAALSDRAGMMVSPKAVKELGAEHDRKPVGAGPWKFVKWADGQNVTVTRHDRYWKRNEPYVDGIEFIIIPDNGTALRSLVAGQNQFVSGLAARYKPIIDRAKNLRFITGPTLFCHQMYFNFGRGPLTNLKIRQAINFALDREAFVAAGLGGLGEPASMQLPSSHWAYDATLAGLYKHDPERARKLMAESGQPNVEISIGSANDQDSLRRNEIVMEQLSKAGIRTRFTSASVAEAAGSFFGVEKKFDVLLSAWTGRPDPSMTYGLQYLKDGYYNAGRAEVSPELTALLQESRAVESTDARRQVFAKIQRIIMEGAYVAPLAFQAEVSAAALSVHDYKPNLLGKPKYNGIWLDT